MRSALIVTVDGGRLPLDHPQQTLCRIGGRAPAEIVLPAETFPRRWLYLHGSTHGVFWLKLCLVRRRGEATPTAGSMPANGLSALAPPRAQLTGGARPPATGTRLAGRGSARPPYPVIVLSIGGQVIERQTLTRRLTIVGRHPPATVQIANRSVSNCHCALFIDAGELWVVDLLSSNGTRLSDAPIESARLSEGETLRLGGIDLTFDGCSIGEERSAIVETLAAADENDELPGSAAPLEDRRAGLDAQKAELAAQREQWRREQDRREAAIAKRLSELEANRAALDARWLEFEQRQASLQQELAAHKQQWEEQCLAWRERQEAAERQLAEERRSWRAEQQGPAASQQAAPRRADQEPGEAADGRLAAADLTAQPAALEESAFEGSVAGLGLLCPRAAVERPSGPRSLEPATAAAGANGDAERLMISADSGSVGGLSSAEARWYHRVSLRLLRRGEV